MCGYDNDKDLERSQFSLQTNLHYPKVERFPSAPTSYHPKKVYLYLHLGCG